MSQTSDNQAPEMQNSSKMEIERVAKNNVRKLSWREDWASIPYLVFTSVGFIVSLLDFIFIQDLNFQISWLLILSLIMLIFGGIMRIQSRRSLLKAGFTNLMATGRLQIVENHQLVTNGVYKHIRHPLYTGELIRNFGFVLIFSSLYGVLFMIVGAVFLLIRIEKEEKMMVEAFGSIYERYQITTKKLIPFLY